MAHLDHGLRGKASGADAAFVAGMAREHGLELFSERLPRPGRARESGSERALRAARLEFLYRTAASWKAERIALGHTRDDQAETLALNLIRGAGGTVP